MEKELSYYIYIYSIYKWRPNESINKQKEERNPPHSFDNEINLIYGMIS